ncbi:hypothetical protein L9F63_004743 [Diploptera punctata]|uniref:26S proteasome non-ATPase regulatory subunit 9 n=1 Tax=Diploptera punctata TaxID=6984 RepID=A0AAD7ZFD8_DIPPU|nr:hypothetical protein L9F63_004743 [Diploptera punctata]
MEPNVTRDSILALIEQKDKLESEINQMKSILDSNKVGMTEPLVDANGYPRQDLDVYQVRHARHQIICLTNDHKNLMKIIEKGLHTLHGQQREGIGLPADVPSVSIQHTVPIARINFVAANSPAEEVGICEEDLIIEFGSVNASNFKNLQDIGNIVQHSQGRTVIVRIKRNDAIMKVNLTPHAWAGRGLLGCNIIPVEIIER